MYDADLQCFFNPGLHSVSITLKEKKTLKNIFLYKWKINVGMEVLNVLKIQLFCSKILTLSQAATSRSFSPLASGGGKCFPADNCDSNLSPKV